MRDLLPCRGARRRRRRRRVALQLSDDAPVFLAELEVLILRCAELLLQPADRVLRDLRALMLLGKLAASGGELRIEVGVRPLDLVALPLELPLPGTVLIDLRLEAVLPVSMHGVPQLGGALREERVALRVHRALARQRLLQPVVLCPHVLDGLPHALVLRGGLLNEALSVSQLLLQLHDRLLRRGGSRGEASALAFAPRPAHGVLRPASGSGRPLAGILLELLLQLPNPRHEVVILLLELTKPPNLLAQHRVLLDQREAGERGVLQLLSELPGPRFAHRR
mmetsp:Transcript_98480/g.284196  ORF Transcript_98480/g.284196 Transcript_98480/m.284196 type:complete len:280 (-) Transcript_98480:279-1118(-)